MKFIVLKKVILKCFVFLLFIISTVFSETYYIDYSGGNDSNNGTSISTPLKHCPGDSNASGIALGTTFKPGDRIIFKGGVNYQGQITIRQSGTLGNEIVFDGNTNGNWGSGKAVIDGNLTYAHGFYGISNVNYINIENFVVTKQKRPAGNYSDIGMIYTKFSNHWNIRNCIIYKPESWDVRSSLDADDAPFSDHAGIRIIETDNVVIDNCEIYGLGRDGIEIFASEDIIINNCDIGGRDRGSETGYFSVAIRIHSSTADNISNNILIKNNIIHDGWQYQGDESSQRSHAGDWIHIYGNQTTNIIIEKNLFYNNIDFVYAWGTATIFAEWDGTSDITIKNNLFINTHAIGGGVHINVNNVKIYNNTFYNYHHTNHGSWPIVLSGSDVLSTNNIDIKNNIFVQLSENNYGAIRINKDFEGIIDYNTYYKIDDFSTLIEYNGEFYSFADWQSEGYDLNGYFRNPNLENPSPSGSTSDNGDYRLSSTSEEIGKGYRISEVIDDYDGKLRLEINDIGAYQYSDEDRESESVNKLRDISIQ